MTARLCRNLLALGLLAMLAGWHQAEGAGFYDCFVSGSDSLSLGSELTCYITSTATRGAPAGTAFCGGANSRSQLGGGDTNTSAVGVQQVINTGPNVMAIQAGAINCAFATHANGAALTSWGANDYGRLGQGRVGGTLSVPGFAVGVPPLGATVASVAVGVSAAAAVLSDGRLMTWGASNSNGFDATTGTPAVLTTISDVVSVASGFAHMCAVDKGGQVWCWGNQLWGVLGPSVPNSATAKQPTLIPNLPAATQICSGRSHNVVLTVAGQLFAWDLNSAGQLGQPGFTGQSSDTPGGVSGINRRATQITCAGDYSCARLVDGSVWCWGSNNAGQLGGTPAAFATPVAVSGIPAAVAVKAGGAHTCAIATDGTFRCWGSAAKGILLASGQKQPAQCEYLDCVYPPPAMPGISWSSCSAAVQPSSTCTVPCGPGFSGGPVTATCGPGTWLLSGSCTALPGCTGSPPSTPANAAWPAAGCNGGATPSGGNCTASCAPGFAGSPTSTCNAGSWGPVVGSCTATGCNGNPPTTPANGAWPAGGCNGGATPNGGRCTAVCSTGYVGSPSATCSAGAWGPISGACTAASCSGNPPSTPANGAWPAGGCSASGTTASGATCVAICGPGYAGAPASTCQLGTWQPIIGTCTGIPCAGLPPVPVADAVWPASCAGTPSSGTCVATCTAGLSGGPTISCTAGSWASSIAGTPCVNCSTVSLVANDPVNVCDGVDEELTFNLLWTAPYVTRTTFSARVLGVSAAQCSAAPLEGPQSGAPVVISCRRADGSLWPRGEYTAEVTAAYTGAAPCANGFAVATANEAVAGMRLEPRTPSGPTCSSASQIVADFSYTVTALGAWVLNYTATTAPFPSTCTVTELTRRGSMGTLRASCAGSFAAPAAVKVALTLTATRPEGLGCTTITDTDFVEVAYVCCRNGTAFAATDNAACADINLPSNRQCRGRPVPTTPAFINRGPTGATPAVMQLDITSGCRSATSDPDLGTLTATCTDERVMAFNLTTPKFSKVSLDYWYGCSPPRQPSVRTCNYFWSFPSVLGPVNADEPALVTDSTSAFFSWIKRLDPAAYPCTCRDLYWAVHQKGEFAGLSVC